MGKVLGNLVAQFRQYFSTLPPVKRASVIASAGIAGVAIVVVSFMISGTNYSALFKDVAPDQLPVIVDQLQKKNIPFRLADDGKTITVPTALLHATQMSIMSEVGEDKIGSTGLELFDKQDFGVTSYAQRVKYQRALQGELMRAINTLAAVKHSKVILALPPKKTFLEEGAAPSASVVLELHSGKMLTQEQVRGITHLVASAVEALQPEQVTVVDSRGKVLSRNREAGSGVSTELLESKRRIEGEIEERVESILSKVVGVGKVMARADVTLEARQMTTVEESVDPDASALRSAVTEEEHLDGARTNPVGVPGSRANLPGAETGGEVGFRQNVVKELKTTNYEVPKTVKNIREGAGGLKRLSIAVLVDGNVKSVMGKDGKVTEEWTPRAPEDLVKYENIVRNTIGFDTARGDSVKIENIRFEKEDFSEAERILSTLEKEKILHALFRWALLGIGLALMFIMVVKPFMRWVTDSFQESVDDMLPRTIEELEELQSVDNTLPGMSGALPILEESLDPDKAESELLKERIMALVTDDNEKAAGAFSLWLSRRDQ